MAKFAQGLQAIPTSASLAGEGPAHLSQVKSSLAAYPDTPALQALLDCSGRGTDGSLVAPQDSKEEEERFFS